MRNQSTWLKQVLLYNFQYFARRLHESDDKAWFSTSGFVALAITLNISAVLFLVIGHSWVEVEIANPGYVLIGIPWLLVFLLLFFNQRNKRYVLNKRGGAINQRWRLYFWIYYIISMIVYAFAMSFYSQVT